MNKKGFAISTMLYGLIFVTISIFYLIIRVVNIRYENNTGFISNVREQLKDIVTSENSDSNIEAIIPPPNKPMEYVFTKTEQFDDALEEIKFYQVSSEENGKGLYLRSTTKDDQTPIMYYRGNVTDNNVLFAGLCWKIVRTTETGGTKMIYNGFPIEEYTLTKLSQENFSSITNDTTYPFTYNSSDKTWTSTMKEHSKEASIIFNVPSDNNYAINYTVSSESGWDKAHFYKNSEEVKVDSGSVTSAVILNGLKTTDTIKITYTKDGSASSGDDSVTFSIGIKESTGGGISCNNTGTDSQLPAKSAYNSNYDSPAYFGYSYTDAVYKNYQDTNFNNNVYFGSSINPSNGRLVDPKISFDETHHYTYNSTSSTYVSSNVRFYWEVCNSNYRYLEFPRTRGSVQNALDDMLKAKANKNNQSTVQQAVNSWYETYILNQYDSYLEDTEWCNDRTVYAYQGFSDNGPGCGYMYFSVRKRTSEQDENDPPSLTCSNSNDRLSVANGQLKYPVGLLTYDEVLMAGTIWGGSSKDFYLYTGEDYWLMSPSIQYGVPDVGCVTGSGSLSIFDGSITSSKGVRPVISLKSDVIFQTGRGTFEDPYRVN